jgi:hypothetical protein
MHRFIQHLDHVSPWIIGAAFTGVGHARPAGGWDINLKPKAVFEMYSKAKQAGIPDPAI